MCRSCQEGGRRCPVTPMTLANGRNASNRYYKRGKARLLVAQLSDHGIPAIDDTAMPVTYHANDGKSLDLSEDREIETDPSGVDKPWNALWTAPGRIEPDGGVKTSWSDWSVSQGRDSFDDDLHIVHPQPGAVVVVIDSQEDAEALLERYSFVGRYDERRYDWTAMQRDRIDGVYLSKRAEMGSWAPRDKTPLSRFHGWDVASVAWLSNRHLEVEGRQATVGEYDIKYEAYDGDPDDDDPYQERIVNDERRGEYESPQPPALDRAWERVPKKVRESKAAERGLSA